MSRPTMQTIYAMRAVGFLTCPAAPFVQEKTPGYDSDIPYLGEIFDKCPIAENRFTSCILLII